MGSSLSSQQAEEAAQANVHQFLDLEAAVNRGGYDSEDDEGDGFINDDDDVGRPVNYQALNRSLDADDHDSLFSDQDSLFSEPQDESAGDNSAIDGGSGLVLDQGSSGVEGSALEFDEDDPNVKRYRSQEVWSVKCKPYRKQDVINFIVGYQKKDTKDNIFSLTRPRSCGSGYVYIQTQDSPRAASILHGCMYTHHTRTGGINGVHMTVLSDPLDILHALSMSSSIAKAITGGVEKRQPDPKKPVLKAGVWVRLGPIEKPKKEPNSEEEASGPPRKKTRLDNPSTWQGLTEENVPMGDIGDIHQQMEHEVSSKPTRGQSYEPELPKPGKPLYFDDPALVLNVDGRAVTVLFILHILACDMPQSQPTKEQFPQSLTFNPLIQSRRPEGIKMAWDPTQYGKKHRRITVYPDGDFQHGMRVQIVDNYPAVISNFPPIEDWRFDISEMVTAPSGQQGVVISHFPGSPVVWCYYPAPDDCDPTSRDSLTTRVGEHCFGWKLIKSWLPSDFVCHVSGVEGFVIIPNSFDDDFVIMKHPNNNINHDFSGHTNSFRLTPRHEKSQGGSEPLWDYNSPRLAVFVMDHVEASAKIKKARTGAIPWKDRRVLIYAKGHYNKGDVAQVYDIHIRQKTKSGLWITVESEVIGRQGQRQMYDYEDLIDEHWELPLHLPENLCLVICNREKTAIIEHYKKQHLLPENIKVSLVNLIANTVDPIFIFQGEFANQIIYWSSSANYNGVRYLHGFEADIKGRTIDFGVKCRFLSTDACVLYVGTEIRNALGQYYKDYSRSNNDNCQC
uniref:Uncharacterized protein n=1 Tax=Moniliophthora roreri TaxID=221103 RepID=A0A0W0FN95_MONRR